MKLLDRLILKECVPWLLTGIGLFTGLYFALGTLLGASRYLARGVPASVVGLFILFQVMGLSGRRSRWGCC